MEEKLLDLIKKSERILITSHVSPDPDAVSSTLLMGITLKHNYPDKNITLALEEEPDGLSFIPDYSQLEFGDLGKSVANFSPDLIVMVDVFNLSRASRNSSQNIRDYITASGAKLAIVDHHVPEGQDKSDVCINSTDPAAASAIYDLLFNKYELSKPESAAETTMVGLYADTGGFIYIDKTNTHSFRLISELVDDGVSIEKIKYQLNQLSEDQMLAIGNLCDNVSHTDGFTYSYLSDEFVKVWLDSGKQFSALQKANKTFVDNYLRVVGNRFMGFSFYRSPLDPADTYSVSFRSIKYSVNVAKIAQRLNGGGHPSAAGGKVVAPDVKTALDKIKAAISSA